MRKILYGICAAAVIVVVVAGVLAVSDICGAGGNENVKEINVERGMGSYSIAKELKESGVIGSELLFKVYSKVTGEHVYQVGLHSLNSSMSYGEITRQLESAPMNAEQQVLIPEGYELRQIADTLEECGLINRDVFMSEVQSGVFDYDFIDKIPERDNRLEGYLFPDTYTFSKNETEHEIIDKMLANFKKQVIPVYEASGTTLTLDEVVTLASVIEREAANDDERAKVSSVLTNRLNIGMKLESCATVQYILSERKNVLSIEDTQIESPYNTYKYSGLPRGPIASPGIHSVTAAIYPESTDYLYFLASADGSYSLFAKTYEEHLENQRATQGK